MRAGRLFIFILWMSVGLVLSGCGYFTSQIPQSSSVESEKLVSLSVANAQLSITEGYAGTVYVSLSQALSSPVTFSVSLTSPRGDVGAHFSSPTTSFTIPANSTDASFTLTT